MGKFLGKFFFSLSFSLKRVIFDHTLLYFEQNTSANFNYEE